MGYEVLCQFAFTLRSGVQSAFQRFRPRGSFLDVLRRAVDVLLSFPKQFLRASVVLRVSMFQECRLWS